jgi:hypothetical protein
VRGIRKRRRRIDAVDALGGTTVFCPGCSRSQAEYRAGGKYLKQLFEKYQGNLGLALAAYNAGPSAVDEANGIPDIPETRNYVETILKSLEKKVDGKAP